MFAELTTERCTPPLQDDSSLSALAGIGLQSVAQTLISVGPTCAEIIHTGSVPRFRRHHTVAGLKGSRFQHLATGISPLLSLVACVFAGVNVLTGPTRWQRTASILDLKWQIKFNSCASSADLPRYLVRYLCLPSSCCQSQPLIGWFARWAFVGHPGSSCWNSHKGHKCCPYMYQEHSLPDVSDRSTSPAYGQDGVWVCTLLLPQI